MFPNAQEDLFTKVLTEYKSEYLKSLKSDIKDSTDILIAYSDLTVWYYNHDCQSALPEIKLIWDSVQGNRLGTKSLNDFFSCLTNHLLSKHQQLTKCVKASKELKQYLQSTLDVNSALEKSFFQIKENEQEFLTYQSNISFPRSIEFDSELVYIFLNLNFAEITDLGSAFCEGFQGFSLEVETKSNKFGTKPVDVNGNQAIWMTECYFSYLPEEKTIQVSLLEHMKRSTKKIAKIQLDLLHYLEQGKEIYQVKYEDGHFYIRGKEKYAIMDIADESIEEAPKVGFSVSVVCSSAEILKEWIEQRVKYFKGQISEIRQDIDGINIKLAQYTAGFKTVAFDENRVYTIAERESGFCCFSPSSGKKKKRSCLIY